MRQLHSTKKSGKVGVDSSRQLNLRLGLTTLSVGGVSPLVLSERKKRKAG